MADEPALDGPLAQYVAKADDSYGWTIRDRGTIGRTSYVELILTSQTWRDIPWKHQLYVIKPSTATKSTAHGLMIITGGAWRDEYETSNDKQPLPAEAKIFAALAETLGTPIAVLCQVPQQPLFDGLVEDALIATTFVNYMQTNDVEWPLLLPMAKSAVRAMDAVTELAGQEWDMKLETFTVTGASKRGWTTWLTAAVDKRVTAIAPIVIDMVNMGPQMRHQIATWGRFSHKIHDYTDRGLHEAFATEPGKKLRSMVDPYHYLDHISEPKLIIIGTNDAYWPLDALNLYWNDLHGDKYILYVPNNGHGIKDLARVLGTVTALHRHAAHGDPLPQLDWQFTVSDGDLVLKVQSDIDPQKVRAWVATSPTRDFRQAKWQIYPSEKNGAGYEYRQELADDRYTAVVGEAVYQGKSSAYFLSTNVKIVVGDQSTRPAESAAGQ